jgi:TPR repeat protein
MSKGNRFACACLVSVALVQMAAPAPDARAQDASELQFTDEQRVQLLLAVARGDAQAQFELGSRYLLGRGVERDRAEGIRWIQEAAKQGLLPAQVALAEALSGPLKNPVEAARWFRAAAEQGDLHAQSRLGRMYLAGQGVVQDWPEAVRWLRIPADQGDAEAQLALGSAYFLGGTTLLRDYRVEGHKWINIAASRLEGERLTVAATARDQLAQIMSRAEIAEAQKRAREWQDQFRTRLR